jgi:hypothetical protein
MKNIFQLSKLLLVSSDENGVLDEGDKRLSVIEHINQKK